MKKMWKKAIAMLLVVIMIGGAAPLGALADMEWLTVRVSAKSCSGTCGEHLTWELDPDTGDLSIAGTGDMQDYSVYGDESMPWPNDLIRHVTIDSGVTSIGNYAFYGCYHLSDVSLPSTLTSIGAMAFAASTLSQIYIPRSVETIGKSAFVTYLELDELIPYLQSITVDPANPHFCSLDGVLFNKEGTELIQYPAANARSTYSIPQSVTSIGYHAFALCRELIDITIPNSVTQIGSYSFVGCYGVLNLLIPNNVSQVGEEAFSGVYNILYSGSLPGAPWGADNQNGDNVTNGWFVFNSERTTLLYCSAAANRIVTIPDGIISIAEGAFRHCTGITSLTIPNSVTQVDGFLFDEGYACATGNVVYFGTADGAPWGARYLNKYADGDFVFESAEKEVLLFCNTHTQGVVSIPSSVNTIGEAAFYGCTRLVSIIIPENVTDIPELAFCYCISLTNIVIPKSVTTIQSGAFAYCLSLISITIPSGVTTIGGSAFQDCRRISNISIPNSVTQIDNYAFENCTSLQSISLPSGITSISEYTFDGCYGLTQITLSEGITCIGQYAFHGCSSLTSITIPNSVTNINRGAFSGCANLTEITIPEGVTELGENAFSNCTNLMLVRFNAVNCSDPMYSASYFSECSALQSVIIGGHVTRIPSYLFSNCPGIINVTIPSSVIEIGQSTFDHCVGLTSVIIPDSVTAIGTGAFADCTGITEVTLGNGLTEISPSVFLGCSGLTNVTFGNGVTSIGDSAFAVCTGLTTVSLPNNVTVIGASAFSSCSNLSHVLFGNNVNTINSRAFYDCQSLSELTIPNSVKTIEDYVFYGCTGLTAIVVPENVTSIGNSAFSGCTSLTEAQIGNDVTAIGSYAFYGCTSLASISVPSDVTSIGNQAFYGVGTVLYAGEATGSPWGAKTINGYSDGFLVYESAEKTSLLWCNRNAQGSVIIPNSVTRIEGNAFEGCSGITNISIPNSVISIGYGAFSGCSNLESISIPSSVTFIATKAFSGCTNISEYTVDENNRYFKSDSFGALYEKRTDDLTGILLYYPIGNTRTSFTVPGDAYRIGEDAFRDSKYLTDVTLSDSITMVSSWAFCDCKNLTQISIPDSVTRIGRGAFARCTDLSTVDLPDGIANISDDVFSGCISLTSIAIPKSVTSIGRSCFDGCTNLISVNIPDSIVEIGSDAFKGIANVNYTGSASGSPWGAKYVNGYVDGNFIFADADKTILAVCLNNSETILMIPENVKTIKTAAFYDVLRSLTYVVMPGNAITFEGDLYYLPYDCTYCTFSENETYNTLQNAWRTCVVLTKLRIDQPRKTVYRPGEPIDLTTTQIVAEGSYISFPVPVKAEISNAPKTIGKHSIALRWSNLTTQLPITVDVDSDTLTLCVQDMTVGNSAGRYVHVPVTVINNPGIISTRLSIDYDTTQLRLVNAKNGDVFDESTATFGKQMQNMPYTVLWSDDTARENCTSNGTLVTLTFEVLSGAKSNSTPIRLTCDLGSTVNTTLQLVPVMTADGIVQIVDCDPGNVNQDSTVNLVDSILISRYLAGGWNVTINEINADVNGDGYVDLKDVVLIRRYLAGGWNVELK